MAGCWIQVADSNNEYFNNTRIDDILFRSDMKESKILISPLKTNGEYATISISSNNLDVYGNITAVGTVSASTLTGSCISGSINSTLSNVAASSGAVKSVYDLVIGASNVANASLPKIGGTMTGDIILSGAGTQVLGDTLSVAGTPSFSWNTDTTTGVYRTGAGSVGISTTGINRVTIDSAGLGVVGALSATSLTGTCISSVTNSTSTNVAASSGAVKTAYDLAMGASNAAYAASSGTGSALPKIGGTMTGDIILSGVGTQVLGDAADAVGTPSFSWSTDSNTGVYRIGAGSVGISTLGVNRATIDSAGLGVVGALSATSLSGSCISSAINSTVTNIAASSSSVKSAYDLAVSASNVANAASNVANAALPKTGGTVNGVVSISGGLYIF